MDTQVIIAGAGPTGLTLAVDLGMRGVRCVLIEQKEAPLFLPKMERSNARSMEIYRRMGLADRIRAAGLPADVPMDVFIVLKNLVDPPLLHKQYPSVTALKAEIAATHDGTLPLEPYQLISQYTLEPFLKSVAETLPSVSVRYGHELLSFTEDANGVTATVKDLAGKTSEIIGGLSRRLRRRGQRGAQAARHQALRQRRPDAAAAPVAALLRGAVRPHPDRQGAALSRRRQPRDPDDRAGLHQALHAAFDRRQRRGHGRRCSRRPSACR